MDTFEPWPGFNDELQQTFPPRRPVFGDVVEFDNGEETLGMNETFSGQRWTELANEDVELFQNAFDWFTDRALHYFVPAFLRCAVANHNGEDMDAAYLKFVCGKERRLLSIGLSDEQIRLCVRGAGWLMAQYPAVYEDHLDAMVDLRRCYCAPAVTCG